MDTGAKVLSIFGFIGLVFGLPGFLGAFDTGESEKVPPDHGRTATTETKTKPEPPPPPVKAASLTDLPQNASQLNGGATPGSATVGGEIVTNALLITLSGVATGTVKLTLGGKYRTLDLAVGQTSTAAGVSGSAIGVQVSADSAEVLNQRVAPGNPPARRSSIPLHGAQTLGITMSDPEGSIYDEAVVAGTVKP